jgi:GntR family transcriptional regulator
LIKLYEVSRPTVRQATEELLNEGYLYRKRGLGTFVARLKFKQELPSVLGFTERMRREGRIPSNQVVSTTTLETPDQEILDSLNLPPNSPIFELRRLRLADNEPIMLETSNLPLTQFPKLLQADFNQISLYEFLRKEYSLTVARLRETLEPVVLKENESKLLGVVKGSPAMLMQISAFASDGRAIEYSQSLVRGDRCQYYLKLEIEDNANGTNARLVQDGSDLIYNK